MHRTEFEIADDKLHHIEAIARDGSDYQKIKQTTESKWSDRIFFHALPRRDDVLESSDVVIVDSGP